ncbi:MAG: TetR family transcriptional regulator [Pseudonocardiaceae bacterium]|nr:TetR family transcriptional regulator [Pseudonocardiaceae bacterium]
MPSSGLGDPARRDLRTTHGPGAADNDGDTDHRIPLVIRWSAWPRWTCRLQYNVHGNYYNGKCKYASEGSVTRSDTAKSRPRGGLADKRRAILTGALTVFARDGYTRASIDAIAAEAGVSTRTVYNHFTDKAELFQSVIQESANRAAEAQIAVIDRHFHKITDLEQDLIEFGIAWATPMTAEHAKHFALVRQINADAGHIPKEAIDAWQQAGPQRVRRELADRIRQLADRGLLRGDDPERTAIHLVLLVSDVEPSYSAITPTEEEITEMVTAGVRAFLHGHARDS